MDLFKVPSSYIKFRSQLSLSLSLSLFISIAFNALSFYFIYLSLSLIFFYLSFPLFFSVEAVNIVYENFVNYNFVKTENNISY